MKKLFAMILFFFVAFFLIQIGFRYIGTGHETNYQIKKGDIVFQIKENYTQKVKNERDNYYLEIKVNDQLLSFQTYEDFSKVEGIIKDIYYFKNDQYACFLPIFTGNRVISDVMCKREGTVEHYQNIKGTNAEIDQFVSTISLYDGTQFSNSLSDAISEYPLTIYPNNVLDKHFIGINHYKGIYTINNINLKKYADVAIFDQDIYERPISATLNQYYITADYQQKYEFDAFKIVDLTNNKVKTVSFNKKLSFNTYIQGQVGNSIYLFDPTSQRQYELSLKAMSLIEIGNVDTKIKYYNNGIWEKKEAYEATQNKLYFNYSDNNDYTNPNYARIDKVGHEKSGFYYLYAYKNGHYEVYRMNVQNKEQITHLFNISNLNAIQYVDDYIYFVENNEIKFYNDKTGIRTVAKNEEFAFNNNLTYTVYKKK